MVPAREATVRRLSSINDVDHAFCCVTEVPTPWPEALCHCRRWLAENLGSHIEGYHTILPDGTVVGHLYFSPAEGALVPYQIEPGTIVLYCEWIQTAHQGTGLGRRQFTTFLEDMRRSGAKGVLVDCQSPGGHGALDLYRRRGFQTVLQREESELLYLPIAQEVIQVTAERPRLRPHRGRPVQVDILSGYQCPVDVATLLLVRQVVQEFGDRVVLRETSLSPQTLSEFGSAAGIFINGRRSLFGGETEEAVRQAILEAF